MKYLLLLLTCFGANAATIQFYMTNSLGQPDTNWFQVIPVGSPILANGGFNTKGIAIKCFPDTNGFFQTNLILGNYLVTNKFLATGALISVPDSPLTFNSAQPGIAISGFNTYNYSPGVQRLTSSDGTVTMTPANGMGTVDLKSSGGGIPAQTATNAAITITASSNAVYMAHFVRGSDWSIWNDTSGNYYAISGDLKTYIKTNDCSALFQTCHDLGQQEYGVTFRVASMAKDGTNIFPYYFTNTVYLYHDGINIFGEGNSACVFRPNPGSSSPIFQVGSSSQGEDGICRFHNIRFEGVSAGPNGVGVLCTNAAEPNFVLCEFNQWPLAGIRISGTNISNENWCFVQNCWFVGAIGLTNASCILVDSARATVPSFADNMELLVRDCDFGLNGGGRGIVVSNQFQYISIQDCRFVLARVANPTNAPALDFEAGDRISIQNNLFQWYYGGTPITFAARSAPTNIVSIISGNTYDGTQPFVTVGANVLGLNITGNNTNGVVYYSGNGGGLSNLPASTLTGGPIPSTVTYSPSSTPAQALVGDDGSHHWTTTIPNDFLTNYYSLFFNQLYHQDGSGLTNLNASNLAIGTVPDARLSVNVPLLNADNHWTGHSNVYDGPIYVGSNSQTTIIYGSATVDGTFTNGGPAYFSNNIIALPGAKFSGDLSLGTNLPAIQLAQRGYHIPTNGVIAYAAGAVTVDCSRAKVSVPTNSSIQLVLGNTAAGTNALPVICITNFGASTIYITNPATSRPIGPVTTNVLALASGKQGYFSIDATQGVVTNYCNASEQ